MLWNNTTKRYGLISILLHWVMALLIIGLIVLGLVMTRIPMRLALYSWHQQLGLLALVLVIVRLAWRLLTVSPSLDGFSRFEKIAAKCMVFFCYVLMIVIPVTGWMLLTASSLPLSFWGLFDMPELITANDYRSLLFLALHQWTAYFLTILIVFHIAAAIKHLFINKDNIMQRITKVGGS